MFKTILKTAVLSAITITFLSACGAATRAINGAASNAVNLALQDAEKRYLGNIEEVIDENGNTIQVILDDNGNSFQVNLDDFGNIFQVKDDNGNPIQINTDGNGNSILTSTSNVGKKTTGFRYYSDSHTGSYYLSPIYLYSDSAETDIGKEGPAVTYRYGDNDEVTYSITGDTQTPVSVVELQANSATTVRAYYNGVANISVNRPGSVTDDPYYETGYTDSARARLGIFINMIVDFDANTIAGTGTERYGLENTQIMTFNSAPIIGNGFKGTFTTDNVPDIHWGGYIDNASQSAGISNGRGQYEGNFFGPNADYLAGLLSFEGTSEFNSSRDGPVFGTGGFTAAKRKQ